jgi:Ca-activated chloride channel family protein
MPRTRTASYAESIAALPMAVLKSRDGATVPLQGVAATGRLQGLVFELTVEQRYRNDSSRNLEAVFTFPLPLRAVLLGLDLELGDRRLPAQAVARAQAAEEYERAIDQGDAAVLLEHNGNGLYTVSLGNLLAGEMAVLRYRYAELLDAHHGRVRLTVPTVIAPRYGDPRAAGLDGPSVPGVDLLAEYPFDIRLELAGLTDASAIRSPSHRITTEASAAGLTVALARSGFLDRDFVLEIDQAAVPPQALVARDGDGYVCLASPVLATEGAEHRPLALKVLLDCSGSMCGESIAAARRALLAMLDRLSAADFVSLTRFGSGLEQVTEGLEPASEDTLTPLKAVVRQIDADLGGTEMKAALRSVLAVATPAEREPDIILITDGEVYDVANIVQLAARSGHRLFAIAIGAAPNEALARDLADKTGGGCEFVGPNDDAEAAIVRTFKRLRATPRTLGPVQWPTHPDWAALPPSAVFPGDTLHLFAGFSTQPMGEVGVTVGEQRGATASFRIPLAAQPIEGDLLPRLAAARRLDSLDEAAARNLAVRYQLASRHTSFVVVAARADGQKATDLPATLAVPHMLAAGWGGTELYGADPHLDLDTLSLPSELNEALEVPRFARGQSASARDSRAPASVTRWLRRIGGDRPTATAFGGAERRALLESLHESFVRHAPMPRDIDQLEHMHPVPDAVLMLLRAAALACSADESRVMAAFLAWLEEHGDTNGLGEEFLAMLRGQVAADRSFRSLRKFISGRLHD